MRCVCSQLTVGSQLQTVGYLAYYVTWIDDPANLQLLIIIVSCGGGGIVLLIVIGVIILVCVRRKKRRKQQQRRPVGNGQNIYSGIVFIVREYVFYVFFKIQETWLFTYFLKCHVKKRKKRRKPYPSFMHTSQITGIRRLQNLVLSKM